jgi:type II secretory pathway pseudopilin PulG
MKHTTQKLKKNSGFTLIETLVYMTLFVILMGGAVISAFNMFQSSGKNQTKIMIQEEGNFLLAKINWSLSGIQSISFPASGSSGSLLSVTKSDTNIGSVDISNIGTDIVMERLGYSATLNNSNVTISNLTFNHENQGGIEWIKTFFTLSTLTPDGKSVSQNFESTKYIRK